MIHGYHVIFGTYGFWLPNDPRGSWSDFVASWELLRFGRTTKSLERTELTPKQQQERATARNSLKYPAVILTGIQARAVGVGFANFVRKSNHTIWACSILEEHVHLVLARHTYKAEQIANLLKGEATKQLNREQLHPLRQHQAPKGRTPTPWASRCWKVYLDNEAAIETAIRYVNENPIKEGKQPQTWSFVRPFEGLDKGWVTYH